ncbi:hypothetical protein PG990_010567 [Apiospora arundinis]
MASASASGNSSQLKTDAFGPTWDQGPILSGEENQSLCRVIRRSRRALAAVDKSSPSLLRMILPLCLQSSSIRHGLLSLSSGPAGRSPDDLYHYQIALSQLRNDVGAAKGHRLDMEWVHRVLASSLILGLFTVGQCDGCTVQHIRGMISIVRMTDQAELASTPLGSFLMGVCSYHDISAFWVGREQPSQRAWTSWMSHRTAANPDGELTALETMMGYPQTLVNIIADIAELVDDNTHMALQRGLLRSGQPVAGFSQASSLAYGASCDELEASLKRWAIPATPQGLSPVATILLRNAWETFRMAAFLYLWRCFGFHSNLLEPIRADRASLASSYVTAIISNCQAILDLGSIPRISIGNALLWPLVVAGCECGSGSDEDDSAILAMLQRLERLYSMEHPKFVSGALQRLWRTKKTLYNHRETPGSSYPSYASLHQVVTEMGLIIPLL